MKGARWVSLDFDAGGFAAMFKVVILITIKIFSVI